MYLLIQKSDKKVLEYSGAPGTTDPPEANILKNVADSYGGATKDYIVFYITDKVIMKRIISGHSYEIIYNGEVPESIDFSLEDARKWLIGSASKDVVAKDGVDYTTLTFEVWKADKSEIDTTFNETLLVPIRTPYCRMKLKVVFVNGVCSRQFQPEAYGKYTYPELSNYVEGLRVENQVFIESVLEV